MRDGWTKHPEHDGYEEIAFEEAPAPIQMKFEAPDEMWDDGGVIGRHEALGAPIAMAVPVGSEEATKILPEKEGSDRLFREGDEYGLIVITSEDAVFKEAYLRGLPCVFARTVESVPTSALQGRKLVLIQDEQSKVWSDHLYDACGDAIEGIWTGKPDGLDLLVEGYAVEEVFGSPEIKPPGEISALPGRGPTYVEDEGVLCQVKYNEDEERVLVPLLNCFPEPVDRIREGGEVFFSTCLVQGGKRSEPFDLTSEISTSYQLLMKQLKRAGSRLPRPPAKVGGKQTSIPDAVLQAVHSQWYTGGPEAIRPGNWGRVSIEGNGDDIWLFEEHAFVPGQGLREIKNDEVYVQGHRVKATPSIDQAGPDLSAEEASIDEVADVIGRAHGQDVADLLLATISYMASKILPSVHTDKRYLVIFVGPKGGGKTTAGKLVVSCFGQDPDEGVSISGSTEAGMLAYMGAYRDLPVLLDEYKNGLVSQRKNALLRQAHDKGTIKKGTVNQGETQDHPLHGIPLIIGEHEPNDKTGALSERALIVDFDNDFGEDTYEGTLELMGRAPSIGPKLYEEFASFGDEAFRELRSEVKDEIGERLKERGLPSVGRRVGLYEAILAAYEVVTGQLDEKLDKFVDHLAESLDRVEQSALHIAFFQRLVGFASANSHRVQGFSRVVDETELRLAATLATSAYEEQAGKQRSASDIGQRDVLNHLKNFDSTWFLGANVNTRFRVGQKKAWCIDLTHPAVPEEALELAQYADGEVDVSLYEDQADGSEEGEDT